MNFSEDQADVVDKILKWRYEFQSSQEPYLTVGGYAGTGKTSILSYLVNRWPGVATAALCGKAAHVLRAKGADAQTIHSLIYVPFENDQGRVCFRKREHLEGVRTICIDEASMIDHLLLEDLLSFGVPVLFVGDHGQLEPIGTNPRIMVDPKLRLEKIHRQAMDNPILRLATAFREGRPTPRWEDPKGRLSLRSKYNVESLFSPGIQVICGFNKTRRQINALMRQKMGFADLVNSGDKLICLRNNKNYNIFNGQQMICLGIAHERRVTLDLDVETDDGRRFTLSCLREQFGNDLVENYRNQEVALLDYGYALTTHKSQGSEWDSVLVIEEIANAWDEKRWRYTAATRAKNRLIYCA